ncbi:RHS repeat-associated core domain-containing protein, partial [Endozoicomonas acroporae]|uniref:RHS repeat-associated core domain-containing protein n=1 Tax=Endozoicomonas acroporae TaxID=1701104 RepID=UPI003D793E2A
ESGLYYNRHRDYAPSLGRYIQNDPIGLLGGANSYVYALANPALYIDPLGLFVSLCDLIARMPDKLKGTLSAGLGVGLGGSGTLSITDDGISGGVFVGLAGGAKGSWKPSLGNLDIGVSKNWGGESGAFNFGTKVEGSYGNGVLVSASGEFGTNGMKLEISPEIGLGLFGGVGLSISGPVLDCKKDKCGK